MAFIDGSNDLPKLPTRAIEILLNVMLGTSTPTLTNLVGDVIEKVRSLRRAWTKEYVESILPHTHICWQHTGNDTRPHGRQGV